METRSTPARPTASYAPRAFARGLVGAAAALLLAACDNKPVAPAPAETTSPAVVAPAATVDATPAATADAAATPIVRPIKTEGGKDPAPSDSLALFYGDDPDGVNAVIANDTVSEAFMRLVYEPLAERNWQNPDEWDDVLAESIEFDEANLEFTIKLRKGIKWHPMKLPNGQALPAAELTAKDVEFTFACILNPFTEAASLRSYYEDPEATDASQKYKISVKGDRRDPYTVKIKWTKPYFLAKEFTVGVPIIPRHVYSVNEKGEPISFDYSSKEFADGFNNHWANDEMCGTGPMMFTQWKKNESAQLERFNDYWGAPYYFSRIDYRCVPNPNTSASMLLRSELDFGSIPEKDRYLQMEKDAEVSSGKVKRVEFNYPAYRYIGYNLKHPFLKEKEVRKALSHAVPVDEIITSVFKGLAVRVNGPFLQGSSASNPNVPFVPLDLEKAKTLLEGAGWKDTDNDGIRDKMVDGRKQSAKFEIMIFSDSPSFEQVAVLTQAKLRECGVDMGISKTPWSLMLQKLKKKEFDATMLGWAMSWRQDPYQIWHSSQADAPDSSNSIGYANPEVDALINELRVTLDEKKQTAIYHKIHELIAEDQPYTFLFSEKQTGLQNGRLENVKFYPLRPCVNSREWFATSPRS